jgi:hypothetical protein
VPPATGIAAACSWLTPSGFLAIAAADAVEYSAYPPLAEKPNTWSPSAKPSAREVSTVPDTSMPSTLGSGPLARRFFQSAGLTDAAWTLISTSPSPGSGRSVSS